MRPPLFVKICGITGREDALMAAEAGADAVGFVFWPGSPRALGTAAARAISRELPSTLLRVGVFVDAPRETLLRTVQEVGLDLVQLHGGEPPESLEGLPVRAWKAIRVGAGFRPEDALRYEGLAAGLLLDTRLPQGDAPPGGTGQTFDWSLAGAVRARSSFVILAGGLDPGNVAAAVAAVDPHGVDVSTGVESSPGRKDHGRVSAFVRAARSARA